MKFSGSTMDALNRIMARDPDGGEREPKQSDYDAHERWARQTFGDDVWKIYVKGGWGETSEV